MKSYFSIILFIVMSCSSNEKAGLQKANSLGALSIQPDSAAPVLSVSSSDPEMIDEEISDFQTLYVLTTMEGYNYDSLLEFSTTISKETGLKIDLGNNVYDSKKGIVLNQNDEDEIYRGEYLPRRHGLDFLSIEMRSAYSDSTENIINNEMKMVVVAGIFEDKNQADSVCATIKSLYSPSKVLARRLFVGCMH